MDLIITYKDLGDFLTVNTWHKIELYVDIDGDLISVYVDGVKRDMFRFMSLKPTDINFMILQTTLNTIVETYIELLEAAGKNFLFLAHERYTYSKSKDAKGNVIVGDGDIVSSIRPGFVGKTMPDDITANFDEIWHLTKIGMGEGGRVKLDCYGDDQILASTRHSGILKAT
ncbi:hypothetical protein LCGC14_2968450, partial [marine sediment metagenome]